MSVWVTKSSGRDREYIVLKHTLRGVNYVINGIKFRNSYAVVEKNSKTYVDLKKIPVLRGSLEFPLTFLKKLTFITRPLDVKLVYGADVYVQYLKQLDVDNIKELELKELNEKLEKEKTDILHIENKKCSHTTVHTNDLCLFDALEESPTGYCLLHILDEPKLVELGIDVPRFIPKKDKQSTKEQVAQQLRRLKREGKF